MQAIVFFWYPHRLVLKRFPLAFRRFDDDAAITIYGLACSWSKTEIDGVSAPHGGHEFSMARGNPYLWAIGGAVLLLSFAIYNGFPIVFEDTVGYLQRPARILNRYGFQSEWTYARPAARIAGGDAEKAWLSGRSVYYGTFNATLAVVGSSWLIIAVQAYLVAAAIAIPWIRGGLRGIAYLVTVAGLSLVTGASVFASTLLPDILIAVAILGIATTVALWKILSRSDRIFLTVAMSYAALSHDSILLTIIVTLGLAAAMMAIRPAQRAWARLVPLTVACGVGMFGGILFVLSAIGVTGEPPLRLPHLTAKLATSTEGRAFLKKICPERRFAVCAFQAQVGRTGWIPFLFSRDPRTGVFGIADHVTKRELENEQLAFGLAMAMDDWRGVARLQLRSTTQLLGRFTLQDLDVSGKGRFFALNVSPALHARIATTQTYAASSRTLSIVSQLTYLAVALAAVLLLVVWTAQWRAKRLDAIDAVAAFLVSGVCLNAVVCANVAGVYDRFQARVVWLVPLAAVIVTLSAVRRARLEAPAIDIIGYASV